MNALADALDVTEGGWLVDVTVLAAGLAAIGWLGQRVIWRLLLVPFGRAIQAAPQIRDNLETLTRIIEADVLTQIQRGVDEALVTRGDVTRHETTINGHSARLQALDNTIADVMRRMTEHEAAHRPFDGGTDG